jgi:hypothetical protein
VLLVTIAVVIALLLLAALVRHSEAANSRTHLGWMSDRWLAEHRAASPSS